MSHWEDERLKITGPRLPKWTRIYSVIYEAKRSDLYLSPESWGGMRKILEKIKASDVFDFRQIIEECS